MTPLLCLCCSRPLLRWKFSTRLAHFVDWGIHDEERLWIATLTVDFLSLYFHSMLLHFFPISIDNFHFERRAPRKGDNKRAICQEAQHYETFNKKNKTERGSKKHNKTRRRPQKKTKQSRRLTAESASPIDKHQLATCRARKVYFDSFRAINFNDIKCVKRRRNKN